MSIAVQPHHRTVWRSAVGKLDQVAYRIQFDRASHGVHGGADMRCEERAIRRSDQSRLDARRAVFTRPVLELEDIGRIARKLTRIKRIGDRGLSRVPRVRSSLPTSS